MQAKKQIITTQDIDIEVAEITLLSDEEYEANRDIIPLIDDWWWLRSPGNHSYYAAYVHYDGSVNYFGHYVTFDYCAVRPVVALRLSESGIPNLNIGDKIEMAGYTWTILRNGLALCDDIVGYTAFREDWQARDANMYEASDIKKRLQEWAKERME